MVKELVGSGFKKIKKKKQKLQFSVVRTGRTHPSCCRLLHDIHKRHEDFLFSPTVAVERGSSQAFNMQSLFKEKERKWLDFWFNRVTTRALLCLIVPNRGELFSLRGRSLKEPLTQNNV